MLAKRAHEENRKPSGSGEPSDACATSHWPRSPSSHRERTSPIIIEKVGEAKGPGKPRRPPTDAPKTTAVPSFSTRGETRSASCLGGAASGAGATLLADASGGGGDGGSG